ncbi:MULTISPECIES: translocation/assembly module TamB domain-containing protein [unclassified Nitratiruptor]|uniref:translocation/assembly module TamB domain-containing protein n=1 Tax=unclassified Nitratiruptor TaxID=2624044 RepID=UPI00191662BF|nr:MULTISPECIES: translocation/assembly module TamB domain-containing protein [unclassified Nitratiruptor]BCD59460.1 translocation and assembly module TamB [Nitratiruptor sp. YY08-10]BCD63384.1 translocation and assembly module TamB [Nitratiruptor sp. YY08-14]
MRVVVSLIELFLLFCMGIFLAETKTHFLQKSLHQLLQQNGFTCELRLQSLHHFSIQNCKYHKKPLVQQVDIFFEYLPLLQGTFVLDSLTIKDLDLKTAQSITIQRSDHSTQNIFDILIKKASITAHYQRNNIKATLHHITPSYATIDAIAATTPYGKADAKGIYKQKKIYLQGTAYPKENLYPHTKSTPIPFELTISTKRIDFEASCQKVQYQSLLAKNIKAEGVYDYKKVHAAIKTSLHHDLADANVTAKILYDGNLQYRAKGLLHNKPFLPEIDYTSYQTFDFEANGSLKHHAILLKNSIFHITANLNTDKTFSIDVAPLQLYSVLKLPHIPKDATVSLKANGDRQQGNFHILSNYFWTKGYWKKDVIEANLRFFKDIPPFRLSKLPKTLLQANLSQKAVTIHNDLLNLSFKNNHGTIQFDDTSIQFTKKQSSISFQAVSKSLQKATSLLKTIYPDIPIIEDVPCKCSGIYDLHKKRYEAKITIHPKKKPFLKNVQFFEAKFHGNMQKIILDYYALVIKGHGMYATKPSVLIKKNQTFLIKSFWIDDSILAQGRYDIGKKSGIVTIHSDAYRYSNIEGEAIAAIDLRTTIHNTYFDVEGTVTIDSATITYAPKKVRTINDKDIIILDEPLQSQSNFFKDHVALAVTIKSKKRLRYKIPELDVWFQPDIMLYKEYQKDLQVLGTVKILKGMYETINSKFIILPSQLNFYGPPTSPMLELYLKTEKKGYRIFITINGDTENPVLHFDSEPPLPANDILALLAFGGKSGSLVSSALGGPKLSALFSNLFIKDLLGTFSIQPDSLSLITSKNRIGFEIGKKLSDKITILYKNDEVSTIIVRYEINDHFEGDIEFGPQKSGAHLFYRKIK